MAWFGMARQGSTVKIAVTGSAGFIGSAVCRLAEARNHEIIHIDRRTGRDIMDRKAVTEAVSGADAVIHLAGVLGTAELYQAADKAVDINIKGTLRVLDACADDARFGVPFVGITMPDVWANIYQATKIAAQRIALGYHRDRGVPVTLIRAFNAYGPGQAHGDGHPQKIIPTFASRAWSGQPIPIWGNGRQQVDLIHVDDIARILLAAAEGSADGDGLYGQGQIYDAGTGLGTEVLEVAYQVGKMVGYQMVEFLPMRQGETPDTRVIARVQSPVGFGTPWTADPRFAEAVSSYMP